MSLVSFAYYAFPDYLTCSKFLFILLFAAVSASIQQLLAAMHGPGTTGILPPERGRVAFNYVWPSFEIWFSRR